MNFVIRLTALLKYPLAVGSITPNFRLHFVITSSITELVISISYLHDSIISLNVICHANIINHILANV